MAESWLPVAMAAMVSGIISPRYIKTKATIKLNLPSHVLLPRKRILAGQPAGRRVRQKLLNFNAFGNSTSRKHYFARPTGEISFVEKLVFRQDEG
jgi:hypothetical protein